jgi:hypothetical protein
MNFQWKTNASLIELMIIMYIFIYDNRLNKGNNKITELRTI